MRRRRRRALPRWKPYVCPQCGAGRLCVLILPRGLGFAAACDVCTPEEEKVPGVFGWTDVNRFLDGIQERAEKELEA